MITFTKEQLIASAHARIEFAEMMLAGELEPLKERTWSIELELARIALASLEAEAVGEVIEQQSGMMMDGLVISEKQTYRNIKGIHKMKMMPLGTKFYTAPPAPANAEPVAWLWSHRKHPREVTLVRPEDDEKAEAAMWSGWSCQALYASPPAPVSVPEPIKRNDADGWWMYKGRRVGGGCAEWYNRAIDDCRAAMLQGADGNSPVIPDDVRRMDWLVSKTVDVREPMVYGSHSLFWSQTITDEEDDYHATKLREQIDAAMEAEQAAAPQQEVK